MAKTKGHGNPSWTREETLLALNLYFQSVDKIPGPNDHRVIELSRVLREHPLHEAAARKLTFRNPDGVAFKLQNLRNVATGQGLGNTSQMDKLIWKEFGHRPDEVKRLTREIAAAIQSDESVTEISVEYEFEEGRLLTSIHQKRERSQQLRKQVFAARRNGVGIFCDACSTTAGEVAADLRNAIFEVHHLLPISASGSRKTKISDTALLCANCHRLTHKAISLRKEWLSIEQIRGLLQYST